MITQLTIRALAVVSLSALVACSNEPRAPKPKTTDPPLTHSWTLPASAGPVARVDLGTHPESNADAMMERGVIAGVLHRVASRCAEQNQLPSTGAVALRFAISESGTLLTARGDPPGGGDCLARELETETDALKSLPAGAALARLELRSDAPSQAQGD